MSELELQTARRGSSRRRKSALKIGLVENIIRAHEKADRPVFLERNPIAGSHIHFVNSVEAIGLRHHVAVDRRQIAAGLRACRTSAAGARWLFGHQERKLVSGNHESLEHIADDGSALDGIYISVCGGHFQRARGSDATRSFPRRAKFRLACSDSRWSGRTDRWPD